MKYFFVIVLSEQERVGFVSEQTNGPQERTSPFLNLWQTGSVGLFHVIDVEGIRGN